MSAKSDRFVNRLAKQLAEEARDFARPSIPSETLKRAMDIFSFAAGHSTVYIPHYWAVYVHDGRGPFGPVRSSNLVWFRDPKEDPRLNNGVQVERAKDIRRLTVAEWLDGLKRNADAIAAGLPPPMIVTKFVKKPTAPSPFFSNEPGGGMYGFVNRANTIGTIETHKHILDELKDVLNISGSVTLH